MNDPTFWDRLTADDGGPRMTHREAARIIRTQIIYCRIRQDREDVIATHGTRDFPPALYDLALRVHFGFEPALPASPYPPRPPRAKTTRRADA